jgi:hypothetical protein
MGYNMECVGLSVNFLVLGREGRGRGNNKKEFIYNILIRCIRKIKSGHELFVIVDN